jgi:membrane-associated phospholipid phosphatase
MPKKQKTSAAAEGKDSKLTTIATILTNVFSPITATLLGMIVIYFRYVQSASDPGYDWLFTALVMVILSVGTLVLFMKYKLISDWDITKREQRPKVLALICIYLVILTIFTIKLGHTRAAPILMLMTTGMIFASFITLFWKISFHTFIVTLFVMILFVTYKSPWILFLLVVPFITAWTRIYLGKHTWKQALGGILLGLGIGVMWLVISLLVILSILEFLNHWM